VNTVYRYAETPSAKSLLYYNLLWKAKVKQSQEPGEPNLKKRDYSRSLASPGPPDALRSRFDVASRSCGDMAVHVLNPKSWTGHPIVLYLHGGSYVVEATRQHWKFLADLVEATSCSMVVPDYPLAPKHDYAEAYRSLIALYRSLLEDSGSCEILFAGDSAGGGLALGLAMAAKHLGLPLPASIVLLSPWLDVTLDNPQIGAIDPKDPFLNLDALRQAGAFWAGGANPRKPWISPIYGDLAGLPPLHLFIGSKDLLVADARRFQALCSAAGANLAYYEFENMVHDWMLLDFKEARIARRMIADIVASFAAGGLECPEPAYPDKNG
jgi:epsilon-lactone hydrolase